MFWMLKRTRYFSCLCFFFYLSSFSFSPSPTAATQQIWGLWAAETSSGPMWRVPQSQVFVFISTRINRLSRLFRDQDQVQLLARSGILNMFKYFPKVAQLAFFFLLFFSFSFSSLFISFSFLFFLCFKLDPCAPNSVDMQKCQQKHDWKKYTRNHKNYKQCWLLCLLLTFI